MSTLSNSIGEALSPGESVLLLSSEFGVDESPVCMDLLTADPSAEEALLSITVTGSSEDPLRQWEQHADTTPVAATVVEVNTVTRSAATNSTTDEFRSQGEDASLRTVSEPSDLTSIGIEITRAIDELMGCEEDRQLVVCFRSLSPLLQYVSREDLFKFVHLLSDKFAQTGAIAHFHMDPGAHDEQTIATFLHLFDGVVEREDSTWELRTR